MSDLTLHELSVRGVYSFTTSPHSDARGDFTVLFSHQTWAQHRLNPVVAQVNLVTNPQPLTLRGMHYQLAPLAEAKTVRCLSGSIYDVVLDIRHGSQTFGRWCCVTLTRPNDVVYVPEGCAHGYLTLEPNTTVLYTVSKPYVPAVAHGIRWDDPSFAVKWPATPHVIADRDATYRDFSIN